MTNLLERDPVVFTRVAAAMRASLRDDPHRPQYHFLPPANWMNDPNGVIQWRGRYHLFYQHNPHGSLWEAPHWGHAVSDDLIHWRDLPIALSPSPGSYDEDGVFSGCAVDNRGVPTIVYTGVQGENQLVCLAMAGGDDPDLITWRKWPRNPVIPQPPSDIDLVAYRDPCVWRWDDGAWYMVHGGGIVGVGGAALLYRSSDLVTWQYQGPMYVGDAMRETPVFTGSMWECPQFFPLGGKHVLLVSAWHEGMPQYVTYTVGAFDGRRFTAEREGILDAGALYAPQTMLDDRGRRLLWGWLRENRSERVMAASGWNGVTSLPWELTLGEDGSLRMRAASEIEALRTDHAHLTGLALAPDKEHLLPMVRGDCLELAVEMECGHAAKVGLTVRRSPDGEEQTRIVYEPPSARLIVDRRSSSIDPSVDRSIHATALALEDGEPLCLRVFLDRSVIEIFANERVALTERIYPTRQDSLGVSLIAEGGPAVIQSLDAWDMRSIWEDPSVE